MWIETTRYTSTGRPATQRLSVEGYDKTVEFSENGKAQVPAELGKFLVENTESLRASDSDDADADTAEAGADTADADADTETDSESEESDSE